MNSNEEKELSRRDFIKVSATAGAGFMLGDKSKNAKQNHKGPLKIFHKIQLMCNFSK
jgi:hypothetical protein